MEPLSVPRHLLKKRVTYPSDAVCGGVIDVHTLQFNVAGKINIQATNGGCWLLKVGVGVTGWVGLVFGVEAGKKLFFSIIMLYHK